jgi:predicted transcriptional regulator
MTDALPLFPDDRTLPALLLSLKDIYFERILRGEKKYEYRRKFYRKPVMGYIFVNAPVSAVRGLVEFGAPIIDKVPKIARIAERERSGGGSSIAAYMSGLEVGFAIPIKSISELSPLSLADIRRVYPQFQPPQSYVVLSNNLRLLRLFDSATRLQTIRFDS